MIGLFAVLILLHSNQVDCARILGVFPVPSISHQIVFQPIWKELSLRGHLVTVLTTNPLNDPKLVNLTEIDVSFAYEIYKKRLSEVYDLSGTEVIKLMYRMLGEITEAELIHPPVQAIINDVNESFDVVLAEFIHPTVYAFSARFNCPLIGVLSLGGFIPAHDAVGNPTHPVLYPETFVPVYGDLKFSERLYSTLYTIFHRLYYYFYVVPREDKVAKRIFGENLPYLGDITKNVSLMFLNTDFITHPIRPNVPAVIEIGGILVKMSNPLPKDLQKELDGAPEGVVYFSLGSNVRSANLSMELRATIISALSELPYKVFWKFEDDSLTELPKNVVIRKWFPQQDVLGHPNVKVFLTQGGLQSMEEAISNGVPLVGMPFFGDQPLNVMKMIKLGFAQGVDTETLTKEQLKATLIEVAENPKYREKIRKIGELTANVPMTGLEKAVWWTEYVIRHKGARHLRSPAVDIPWYQYLLLDVLAFVLGVILMGVFLSYKIVCFIAKKLKGNDHSAQHKHKVS